VLYSTVHFLGLGFPAHFGSTMAYYRHPKYTRGEDDGGVPPTLSVRDVVGKQYSESYEAAHTNFVPARGCGRTATTNARRSYNIKRTDSLRASRGRDSMRQITKALDAKLGVGLKEVEDPPQWCLIQLLIQVQYKLQ